MIITEEQIIETQKEWGAGIVEIGALKNNRVQCEKHTNDFLDKHYTFESNTTLFKPTRCSQKQFRPTKELALSYFIAGDNRACDEDKGFAINPWTNVDFENFNIS